MRKIFIISLCLLCVLAQSQSSSDSIVEMISGDISNLSSNGQSMFRIQALPEDSGYHSPDAAHLELYSLADYPENYVSVQEKAAYFPGAKRISILFYVSKHIRADNLRYYIEENDQTKIIDWQVLPDMRPTRTENEFNIYELKNIPAENRFLKIGIYSIKEPGLVLYQTTSTIALSKPILAAIFTFQNKKSDITKDNEGKELRIYGSKVKNIDGLTFSSDEIISGHTVFMKTNNAPQLFKLFIEYGKERDDYMFYEPKWIKLSLFEPMTALEDSMRALGFNYKAELRRDLLRPDSKHEMFLYYNYNINFPENFKKFDYQSNKIIFTKNYKLSWKDFLAIGFIFGLPTVLAALVFFMWYKNKQRRKLQSQKFATAEAKLKLQSIRSQLNPHFIFNALAGIQNLMHKKETEKANEYLGTFSRLTRNVLDDSNKEVITLDNEIKLLGDYLKMEQLRFGFQYNIKTDETLDRHNIEIPAMLLQPFAENAVKHGIAHLKENGLVEIEFKKSANDLVMSVSDNGAGFDANGSYNGMGLQLSKNRISLLNTIYKTTPLDLQINSSPKGTKAVITLPNWLS